MCLQIVCVEFVFAFLVSFWLDICPSGLKNERDNNAKTLKKILIFYKMVIISKSYQKERHNENGYSQK